ncbi:pyridoxal phosphate-dependent transferase, partial [Gaertneriomyces semiglobifer]
TVTKPTPEMITAMYQAEVGDDVYEEDPSVNALQTHVAALTSHEDSLFCPSATMCNQLAIRTHLTSPPYTVLLDQRSHIHQHEAAGVSFHCGAGVVPVIPAGRFLDVVDVDKYYVRDTGDIHVAPTRIVCLENTIEGEVMPLEQIRRVVDYARKNGMLTHLDGSRLWNAHVATGVPLAEYTKLFDSATLCFSKGLGAPIGGVLVGNERFIKRAKGFRKLFGGGWRQAGHLAAACMYSLEHHLPLLHQDHDRAKWLAENLPSWLTVHSAVETNMVWIKLPDGYPSDLLLQRALEHNIRLAEPDGGVMRVVVHVGMNEEGIRQLVKVLQEIDPSSIV